MMIFMCIVGFVVLSCSLFWIGLILYSKTNNELDEILGKIDDDDYTPL